ncbi:MAG: glycoside hydrolase family 3 N-terminal domain-containing protein [Bacteroidota bacterium]
MKRIRTLLKFFFLGFLGINLIGIGLFFLTYTLQSKANLSLFGEEAAILNAEEHSFRDLNKNGRLDPYEDARLNPEERVEDLLKQMNLEEKAGSMFSNIISPGADGELREIPSPFDPFSFMTPTNSEMIARKHMNHFNIFPGPELEALISWQNKIQKLAERSRLGIPITISSDLRHAYTPIEGAPHKDPSFSSWCTPLGLAASRDTLLVEEFGNIARQEYLASGIRQALHPMADLATEPRWARISATFGEDAALSASMTRAYIRGFQGREGLHTKSVACVTKHFSGAGPQKDGKDAHFYYGKEQVYPGGKFQYHLLPFEAALEANTAQIMPYYGIPVGQSSEEVGFCFNEEILSGLLRGHYGFEGVIYSDWGILSDRKIMGIQVVASPEWGMEGQAVEEKMKKALDAGIDQFGGESLPEVLVELVKAGKVPESRLDESVRRILLDKFKLGLFENPYLELSQSQEIVGKEEFVEAGKLSQRKSMVLLKNEEINTEPLLPLKNGWKIYVENLDPAAIAPYGQIVSTPAEADIAILRLMAPWQEGIYGNSMLEKMHHQGDLDFKGAEKERIMNVLNAVPSIVDIYLERPAVIPEISEAATALIGNFGAEDDALLDIIFGKFKPSGKLPFELPSSMEAVANQMEDVPFDSEAPLYPFGAGLSYSDNP